MENRKTPVNFHSFTVSPRTEHSKEFQTMFEILNDAEKYHEAGEKEVCKSMLETLKNYIDNYDSEYESRKDNILKNSTAIKEMIREIPKTEPNQRTLVD